MNSYASLGRVYDILQQKANMGMGGVEIGGRRRRRRTYRRRRGGDLAGDVLAELGMGEGYGGYRRKRAPSAFNKAVSAHMRRTGSTLAQASHAVSGKRSYGSKSAKRRRGGVAIGGRGKTQVYWEDKAQRIADELDYEKEVKNKLCAVDPIKDLKLRNVNELKRYYSQCNKDPYGQRKEHIKKVINKLITDTYPKKKFAFA